MSLNCQPRDDRSSLAVALYVWSDFVAGSRFSGLVRFPGRSAHKIATRFITGLVLMIVCAGPTVAQFYPTSSTAGSTPLGLRHGAVNGGYSLSNFDRVSAYSGTLDFNLPLLYVAGRGDAAYTITQRINSKPWHYEPDVDPQTHVLTLRASPDEGFPEFTSQYEPLRVIARSVSTGGEDCGGTGVHQWWLTKLFVVLADGSQIELRDTTTDGRIHETNCFGTGLSRGTVFVSNDGSGLTFTSDGTIQDTGSLMHVTGYLRSSEGMTYRIENDVVRWLRDRNGNKMEFSYDALGLRTITDSLNRVIQINYVDASHNYDQITFYGFGRASRTIKIFYADLGTCLRSGYQLKTYRQLEIADSDDLWTTQVISAIEIPNGKSYSFKYNAYADLARVELPTGGAYEYDHDGMSVTSYFPRNGLFGGTVRRVVEKRSYKDGVNLEGVTTFSYSYSSPQTSGGVYISDYRVPPDTWATIDQLDAQRALVTGTKHHFHGVSFDSLFKNSLDYPGWDEGKEFETETFAANGTTKLRRVELSRQQRTTVSWWTQWLTNSAAAGLRSDYEPAKDPRLVETIFRLLDTNQVTKTSAINPSTGAIGFDQFNNPTDIWEFDYGNVLKRRTHIEYLTVNPVNSIDYTGAGIHIRRMPALQQIFNDQGQEVARTSFEYDNYSTAPFHNGLINRTGITGLCTVITTGNACDNTNPTLYVTRGNVTSITRSLLTNGVATGSVSSQEQYDVAGNGVKSIDPLGNVTDADYTDCFGGPNAEARTSTLPQELTSGQSTFAFPTKVTNALGHIAYTQYDFYLGNSVDSEDPNGVIDSSYCDDSLDRLSKVIRAANKVATRRQTLYSYDDTNRVITTTGDQNNFQDQYLKNVTLYDGFGRTTEVRLYETSTDFVATNTDYDALGRPYRRSNPYRAGQTVVWNTTSFDSQGRIISTKTPDNALVTLAYHGARVLVTDQANKQRISQTDALGRLTDVWEIVPANSQDPGWVSVSFPDHTEVAAGYLTHYDYDTLGNMVTVSQRNGTSATLQTRNFGYDSLGRLKSAQNPESGTITYTYDANGNLKTRTDARSVLTTYGYDALNRNISITYSNSPISTPNINRYYDGSRDGVNYDIPNSVGRLWQTETTGTNAVRTTIGAFDDLGRASILQQQFYINGWSQAFTVGRTFNRAGNILTQSYPSGHSINYAYDRAGRLSSFTGNLGEGVPRNYATDFKYNEWGKLQQERFGTSLALYHKQRYNQRGQLWDMRLSTVSYDADPSNGDRGSLVNYYSNNYLQGDSGTDNNGNLLRQEIYVPGANYFQQSFTYDELNRLTSIAEKLNGTGSNSFKQSYGYDRWGNRTIDQANTTTNVPHPAYTVNSGNNHLVAPAGSYLNYDNAGNLTQDYTAQWPDAINQFDAENRLSRVDVGWVTTCLEDTGMCFEMYYPPMEYTYDADGRRVRRKITASYDDTWYVYGFSGELLAEYPASQLSTPAEPAKEYGYRNGQLLITAQPATNLALNKPATQIDDYSASTHASEAVDGDTNGVLGTSTSATGNHPNSWWQVDLQSVQSIDSITIWGRTDCCSEMSGDLHVFVSNVPFTSTDPVVTQNQQGVSHYFYAGYANAASMPVNRTGRYVRVQLAGSSWLVLGEVQVWQGTAQINWMMGDHLGTPRFNTDKTGALSGVFRHDYLPFGEELPSNIGGRNYNVWDGLRHQFTQKERDMETGLDYYGARYFASAQGRFTSADPMELSARMGNPQTWNRYSYVSNQPTRLIDPFGYQQKPPEKKAGDPKDDYPDDDGRIVIYCEGCPKDKPPAKPAKPSILDIPSFVYHPSLTCITGNCGGRTLRDDLHFLKTDGVAFVSREVGPYFEPLKYVDSFDYNINLFWVINFGVHATADGDIYPEFTPPQSGLVDLFVEAAKGSLVSPIPIGGSMTATHLVGPSTLETRRAFFGGCAVGGAVPIVPEFPVGPYVGTVYSPSSGQVGFQVGAAAPVPRVQTNWGYSIAPNKPLFTTPLGWKDPK
jgi:RHS repeat-associated protein